MLNHIDLFAGVSGFGLGLKAAGVARTVAWSDVERNACDVMRFRHPVAAELGDITRVRGIDLEGLSPPEDAIVTAGTPCQDLSIANVERAGLAGERSGLFHEYVRVLREYQPAWTIWENVSPGSFTSNGGRDFGTVLGSLADSGYVLAWRELDLQSWLPQRRRRVFVVGRRASAVGPAPCQVLGLCPDCGWHPREDQPVREVTTAGVVRRTESNGTRVFVKGRRAQSKEDYETWTERDVAPTLNLFDNASESRSTVLVREGSDPLRPLMPVEHERLMGFPDGWTRWGRTAKGKEREIAPSARKRLCGNGAAAPQVEWIARGLGVDA